MPGIRAILLPLLMLASAAVAVPAEAPVDPAWLSSFRRRRCGLFWSRIVISAIAPRPRMLASLRGNFCSTAATGCLEGWEERRGDRPGQAGEEPADRGDPLHQRRPANAAEGSAACRCRGRSGEMGGDGRARSAARGVGGGGSGRSMSKKGKKFWAFQPLGHPRPPGVKDGKWARTDIDRFVLAMQEQKGLAAGNPPAGREKLIRRASFDLLGLPPAPEEVLAFVNDATPGAYEKLLDRLLASLAASVAKPMGSALARHRAVCRVGWV